MQGSSYLVALLLLSGSLAGCTSSVTEPETTLGCTYPDALNFNEYAVTDDGSCEYSEPPDEIPGCTYEGATNYDEAKKLWAASKPVIAKKLAESQVCL